MATVVTKSLCFDMFRYSQQWYEAICRPNEVRPAIYVIGPKKITGDIAHGAAVIKGEHQISSSQNTPYLVIVCELWHVSCKDLGESAV